MIGRALNGAWDFVVGDDWRVAAWVVLTLGAVAAVAALGLPGWLLAPVATLAILRGSVRRGARASRPGAVS